MMKIREYKIISILALALFWLSCGSKASTADDPSTTIQVPTKTFKLIISIDSSPATLPAGLTLKNNNANPQAVPASATTLTSFDYTGVVENTNYSLTVVTDPMGLRCSVNNGSGTMASADVSTVSITCVEAFSVGGTITALGASGLTLINNGGDDLIVGASDTTFTFATNLIAGAGYNVTVKTHPPGSVCTPSVNNNGTISGVVNDIVITCVTGYTVGGTIANLGANGLVLQNNSSDNLVVNSGQTSFTFATSIPDTNAYAVSILSQPTGHNCSITSGATGVISSAHVTNVIIACTPYYGVGGSVTNLVTSGLVLQNNGTDDKPINANATIYNFPTTLASGSAYNVTVLSQPTGYTCTVSNPSGGSISSDVSNASVNCQKNSYSIGGTITGLSTSGLILQNNLGDDFNASSSATSFTFSTLVYYDEAYSVTVSAQPSGSFCTITNNTGTVATANVTNVALNCTPGRTISGDISSNVAANIGNKIYILTYANLADADEPLKFISKQEITVTSPGAVSNQVFNVSVGSSSTYYLRIYRDQNFDTWPTITQDPQLAKQGPYDTSATNVTGLVLTLNNPATANHYSDFNVFTLNSKAKESPCQGYSLRMEARQNGSLANLTSPNMRMPNNAIHTLLDDGACDGPNPSNASSSFDYKTGDNQFAFGKKAPSNADIGDYTFYYREKLLDHINISVDNMATIGKLNRAKHVTSPMGNMAPNTIPVLPTIAWPSVPGTVSCQPNISITDGTSYNPIVTATTGTSVTLTSGDELIDDKSYRISVRCFDVDMSLGTADADQMSESVSSYFTIDQANDNTISVSGNITNNSGTSGKPLIVQAYYKDEEFHSSAVFAPGATTYQLYIPAHTTATDEGRVKAFYDVAGNNDEKDPLNEAVSVSHDKLNSQINIVQHLSFNPPVLVVMPSANATGVGPKPNFTWQNYGTTAGANAPSGSWHYVFFASPAGNSGTPPIIWALPKSTVNLNLNAMPSHPSIYDLGCVATGGSVLIADGSCSGGTSSLLDLSSNTSWGWGMVIAECNMDAYVANPSAEAATFKACVSSKVSTQDFYAESGNRALITN